MLFPINNKKIVWKNNFKSFTSQYDGKQDKDMNTNISLSYLYNTLILLKFSYTDRYTLWCEGLNIANKYIQFQ